MTVQGNSMVHVRNLVKTLIYEMFSILMVTHPSSGLASLYRNTHQVMKQKRLTVAIKVLAVCAQKLFP